MRRAYLVVTLSCVLTGFGAGADAGQQGRPPQSPPPAANQAPEKTETDAPLTQVFEGLRVTVLAVERVKECQLMAGPNPIGPKLTADAGQDCALVRLKVAALNAGGKAALDVSRIELVSADGSKYKSRFSYTSACSPGAQPEKTCGLPISVPTAAKLKRLQIGDVSFDLEKLEK